MAQLVWQKGLAVRAFPTVRSALIPHLLIFGHSHGVLWNFNLIMIKAILNDFSMKIDVSGSLFLIELSSTQLHTFLRQSNN